MCWVRNIHVAHARATIPVISHDFVAISARSIALNLFSHGAFWKKKKKEENINQYEELYHGARNPGPDRLGPVLFPSRPWTLPWRIEIVTLSTHRGCLYSFFQEVWIQFSIWNHPPSVMQPYIIVVLLLHMVCFEISIPNDYWPKDISFDRKMH